MESIPETLGVSLKTLRKWKQQGSDACELFAGLDRTERTMFWMVATRSPRTESRPLPCGRSHRPSFDPSNDTLRLLYSFEQALKKRRTTPDKLPSMGRFAGVVWNDAKEPGPKIEVHSASNGLGTPPEQASDGEDKVTRELLLQFYAKHAPEKVDKVDDFFAKYAGRLDELVQQLTRKYGESPLERGTPRPRNAPRTPCPMPRALRFARPAPRAPRPAPRAPRPAPHCTS